MAVQVDMVVVETMAGERAVVGAEEETGAAVVVVEVAANM